jgi:hypothetical protein
VINVCLLFSHPRWGWQAVCPEHEHWQQRTLLNPISTSRHFTEPNLDYQEEDEEDENTPQAKKVKHEIEEEEDGLEVGPPTVLSVRDQNLDHRPRHRGTIS